VTLNNMFGITFALLSGVTNALGAILQKSAVNRIIARSQSGSFTAQFVRDPIWIAGLVISMGFGTILNLSAQSRIGPALVPGLAACSMVVLALGSTRLLGEKLKPTEWIGILLLVLGIASLGLSKLEIPKNEVNLLNRETQNRLILFSAALVFFWWTSWLLAKRTRNLSRWLIQAVSAGVPFCLSNLWILPMLITIGPVFSGSARTAELVIFIISCSILVFTNMLGIQQTQESYRYAPANKAQPIQQIPTQIVPILIYLIVFQRVIAGASLILVPMGVSLILAGGTLLAQRKRDMNREDGKTSKETM
jgi:drug/metabolite transporter (DMT)-like permease